MRTTEMYKIIRFYFDSGPDGDHVIRRGLTLDEAQAHCMDPETASRTATSPEAIAHTEQYGPWFDGWTDDIEEAGMLREYVVQALVTLYVSGQSAGDAADNAWDELVDKGMTPKTVEVLGQS